MNSSRPVALSTRVTNTTNSPCFSSSQATSPVAGSRGIGIPMSRIWRIISILTLLCFALFRSSNALNAARSTSFCGGGGAAVRGSMPYLVEKNNYSSVNCVRKFSMLPHRIQCMRSLVGLFDGPFLHYLRRRCASDVEKNAHVAIGGDRIVVTVVSNDAIVSARESTTEHKCSAAILYSPGGFVLPCYLIS
ncbi:hypothetical protein B0H11DRAFT_2003125 [Mycena galericulata]|nr:hypothetical protein B0H11DRAFT_2003125 [Mycena galericulata]